jgi:alkanesulfonate monooxygenase SsuD/methylene tetrahydromethanopterin reductase-like flavin-dependent oxidoreductase (luciferase family)
VAQIRAEQARAGRPAQASTGQTVHVFADLVVFLDETKTAAVARRQRLDERAGTEYHSDARIFTGTAIGLADLLQEWQAAERGKFDFLFLAEGLRLREQNGLIYDLDVAGRPDTFTVLAALAAVTEHVGLTGTVNSTFNEPYEVARQFASLDHLSGGRSAWNVVTSWDAFTGENFRRGGYLAQSDRYQRARTFLATATELWDSWHGDEILADKNTGHFLATAAPGTFRHRDTFFDIAG